MANLPAISVSECDPNRPLLEKPMGCTASYRSSSVKSSRSRITLVGYNAELEPKIDVDVMYGTTDNAKDFSWFDHLLAVFCISRRPKIETAQTNVSEREPEPKDRQVHLDSPWVLPVYVLSTKRDEHRHLIPKEAKCTIDTGNLQGNIVSRTFLIDVLGYSEANFHKLTKEEEDGGTGITGHRLIPDGAIYLTWYHSNSTRVFRDMRFLVSEHPMYDLIIGARSIRKNNILDVPNLMDTPGALVPTETLSPELKKLESAMNTAKEAARRFRREVNHLEPKPSPEEKKKLVGDKENEYNMAKEAFDNEHRAEYKVQVQKAEKHGDTSKALKLRDDYKRLFGEELPTLLPEEEKPKTSGQGLKDKDE